MNKEGKPITFSYENESNDKVKDGHRFRQSTKTYKNGKTEKCILEKQYDDQIQKVVKTKNEKGENNERRFLKGLKEDELEAFNKLFDFGFEKDFMELDDGNYEKKKIKRRRNNVCKKWLRSGVLKNTLIRTP